jgi:NAD(P)H-nitrite reductase large subunit
VTDRTIRECIQAGAETVEAVSEATRAGTGCGSCKTEIGQLITSLRKASPPLEAAS